MEIAAVAWIDALWLTVAVLGGVLLVSHLSDGREALASSELLGYGRPAPRVDDVHHHFA